jgi:hypothetical protein
LIDVRPITLPTDRLPTEHEEQREFVRWFRQSYPGTRIFAIPNGGARSKATAGKLKAEGVSSGVPDLFIPAWGLWIEMKRVKRGKHETAQKDWASYLEACGYSVILCKGALAASTDVIAFDMERRKSCAS